VRITRNGLRDIAEQFQNWVKNRCQKWGTPILDALEERRDDSVDPYFLSDFVVQLFDGGWTEKYAFSSNLPSPFPRYSG
jgi:hypothetical protein